MFLECLVVIYTLLAWDRDLSLFHEALEGEIGKEKLRASLHMISDKTKAKNNLSAQCKDLVLKFFAMENSSKPWNRAEEFAEFEEGKGRRNDVMLLKEGRFGRQCLASLKCIDILESALEYLKRIASAKMKSADCFDPCFLPHWCILSEQSRSWLGSISWNHFLASPKSKSPPATHNFSESLQTDDESS